MRKLILTCVLASGAVLFAGACSSTGTRIEMTDGQRFQPSVLRAKAGDTVVFANSADEAHTVTAVETSLAAGASFFASGGFLSEEEARANLGEGLIDPGETFEVTFDLEGTYEYFCIPHEAAGMRGSVVVTK